jgi:hypothetical protein
MAVLEGSGGGVTLVNDIQTAMTAAAGEHPSDELVRLRAAAAELEGKRGGKTEHGEKCRCSKCMGGSARKEGGKVEGKSEKMRADRKPRGKHHPGKGHHTQVNVIVGGGQPKPVPVPVPVPVPTPAPVVAPTPPVVEEEKPKVVKKVVKKKVVA